jgi:hypothetical protein
MSPAAMSRKFWDSATAMAAQSAWPEAPLANAAAILALGRNGLMATSASAIRSARAWSRSAPALASSILAFADLLACGIPSSKVSML